MSATTEQNLNLTDDGWTKVATNPDALTIKCNTTGNWFVAVTSADSAPTVRGETYQEPIAWVSGPITGYVWVKAGEVNDMNFAITE